MACRRSPVRARLAPSDEGPPCAALLRSVTSPRAGGPARKRRRLDVTQVVIIGAGPAGLASALALQDRGLQPIVLDKADAVGSSWRGRYDRLRLNSPREFSHLPGRRFADGTPRFPSRDDMVAHLEQHAAGLDLRFNTEASRIDRARAGWVVQTGQGPIEADEVIVATGH